MKLGFMWKLIEQFDYALDLTNEGYALALKLGFFFFFLGGGGAYQLPTCGYGPNHEDTIQRDHRHKDD
jgi:hypothetical protein